jgi:hypothetical protein
MTIKLKMFQHFSEMSQHFFNSIFLIIFRQHFTNIATFSGLTFFNGHFLPPSTFSEMFQNFKEMFVSSTNFLSIFCKILQYFFINVRHHFSIFRLLPAFLRNVGFVNYFLSIFMQDVATFYINVGNKIFLNASKQPSHDFLRRSSSIFLAGIVAAA